QIANPARLRLDKHTRFVVAGGLSDVDGVLDAVDHIEIVAGEGWTEQRLLVARTRIDAAKDGRRPFEPFPERRAIDLHHPQTVGVRIDVGDVLDCDQTRWDVGVKIRSAAPSAFE